MGWMQAVGWGLTGGLATGVLMLMTEIKAAGFRWPWTRQQLGPKLCFIGCGLLLGAIVSAAAHSQISGAWPAFIFGAGAPATVRGALSGVEVRIRPDTPKVGTRPRKSVEPVHVAEEGADELLG